MAFFCSTNPLRYFDFPACHVAQELDLLTERGTEESPESVGATQEGIEELWEHLLDVYRTGMHPGIQVCVRRSGKVVLHRAIGHASGNSPEDHPDSPKRAMTLDTPINIFSASKAVTAMLVHKLVSQGVLHLDDWISDYIPEFARHGKERISIRHVLAHRAGLPNLPDGSLDLDLLNQPNKILELLCDARPRSRPGRMLAYHAVTGGFILGAVMEQATGRDLRELLRTEIAEPLGLRWLNYGAEPDDVDQVAVNAYTGLTTPPPLNSILRRALGTGMREVVDLSNDRRFLTGVLPSANVCTTADELSKFYQCLLDGGVYEGKEVFDRRCIRHAVAEQSWWEVDFTLIIPMRYGLGFMLGNKRAGPFGTDTEHAFGHVGLSNIFSWADPERQLSVSLLTTGKAIAAHHVVPLFSFINQTGSVFPKTDPDD
jgi:CubicO group peptidase (beta-lactamase class C family)